MGLDQLPVTRVSLLVRLRDGDDMQAWPEFIGIYAPVVYGFARKRGLQDADAADLMQEVLRSLSVAARRLDYDPARGSFRGWLFTITRNKVYNFLDKGRRQTRGSGDSGAHERMQAVPDRDDGLSEEWDREYQRRLAAIAMERVQREFQPATWQAFTLTAVDGLNANEAGTKLKMSPGAVYVAKSRVLARLKEEVQKLQAEDLP